MKESSSVHYIYHALVGTSPLAVSNAIVWFFRKHPEIQVDEIRFIVSEPQSSEEKGTKHFIGTIVDLLKEDASELLDPNPLDQGTTIKDKDPIEVPEADLPRAISIISQKLKDVDSSKGFIMDLTAGRKAMGNALLCVGIHASGRWKRPVKFHYYLLKKFSREMMSKRATELSSDDVESYLFDVEDINAAFSQASSGTTSRFTGRS